MKRLALGLFAILFSLAACKHDDDVPDTPPVADTTLDLSSQFYTNTSGQPAGRSGDPEDFRQETWEPWVKAHFAALDTATLPPGAATADDIERVYLFPNPGPSARAMYFRGIDRMNVKMVLLDRRRTAKWKTSFDAQGSSNSGFITVQLPASELSSDSLYRLYYAFSLAESPYFHTSHADITVRP